MVNCMNILITGARSGIGLNLAKRLSLKHNVYAACHNEAEVITINKRDYSNITFIKLDITNINDYHFIEDANIDCLVNQAGNCIGGSLLDLEISDIKDNFEVNVFSTLRISKYFIDYCKKENKKGRILVTSSLIQDVPLPFLGSYVASKTSLSIITKILRKELKLCNSLVDIKLILPGAYRTGFNQIMINDISNSKYFPNNYKNRNRLKMIFSLIESKNIDSITKQQEKAINSRSNKFIFTAPKVQYIIKKIYAKIKA